MSYQDSNLDKQNQNLMCYHYTIGQSALSKKRAKVHLFSDVAKKNVYLLNFQFLIFNINYQFFFHGRLMEGSSTLLKAEKKALEEAFSLP